MGLAGHVKSYCLLVCNWKNDKYLQPVKFKIYVHTKLYLFNKKTGTYNQLGIWFYLIFLLHKLIYTSYKYILHFIFGVKKPVFAYS